ncbi:MAG: peptidyl-prolyl cis-trans isomerase [Bdellovibrionales bacterium]
MLQSMRNGVLSGVFLVILALGALGLVLADGGGFFRDGLGSTDVAKIGDKSIHIAEFDRSLRMVLRQQGVGVEQAYSAGLIHQYLAQELNRTAVRQEASDLGMLLSKEKLASAIGQIIDPAMSTGLSKEAAFERLLQMSNMSEKDLLQEIREDTTSKILYTAIAPNTLPVSDELAQSLTQLKNHTRTISFINLPHSDVSGVQTPSDEELKKYYETVKSRYASLEKRDLSLLIIDSQRLKDSVDISEDQVKTYYEDHIDQYTKPERRELHQAIFEDEATANNIVTQFNNTLEDTVKNVTGDTKAFVGIEAFNKEDLLEEIAQSVFEAKNEDIVGPIKTALGWHVFQVTGILSKETTPVSDVTDEIKDAIFQEKVSEELYALADELDERLVNGEEIEALVKELPVNHIQLDKISPLEGSRLSKLSAQDQQLVFKDSFQLYENENTPIEEFSDGRFFTVYVHKIHPSKIPPLEEVKEKVVKTWTESQKQTKNFAQAQELLAKLQDGKDTVSSHTAKTVTLKRNDTAPFNLSNYAMDTFFSADQGDVKMTTTSNGIVIGKIETVNIPEVSSLPKEDIEKAKQTLEYQAAQEIMSAYVGHLQLERKAKVNDTVITQYYGKQDE